MTEEITIFTRVLAENLGTEIRQTLSDNELRLQDINLDELLRQVRLTLEANA